MSDIRSIVYSAMYKLAARYYKLREEYENFYKYSL